jgi:hypothetical protein
MQIFLLLILVINSIGDEVRFVYINFLQGKEILNEC